MVASDKFCAWASNGWLSAPPYYDFWGNVMATDLHPYLANKAIVDIGAGKGKIWEVALSKGLALKKLELIDPYLDVSAALADNPIVQCKQQHIEQVAHDVQADVFFFKSSFHFAYDALNNDIFALAEGKTIINLAMPEIIGWPVSEKFKLLYAPTCLDFNSIARNNKKVILYHKQHSYVVRMTRDLWIEMLRQRFVSCLHSCDDAMIEQEIEWASTHLDDMLVFDDALECTVCA